MFTTTLFYTTNSKLSDLNVDERPNNWIKRSKQYLFALWGVTAHLILIWGVLDVNFHSPVLKELPNVPAPDGAPAKRVLLFVADGLRFQTFIDKTPPYLRDVIENRGVWGISHTRVPTESRPGHVAIAAGLYEDPSAIFKGWQENPVDFDSIFNESYATWAWGSPDIIPLFTKGDKQNVHGKSYPSTWQDFDANLDQTMRLDSWVFDAYLGWLQSPTAETVRTQDRIVLFLHLLGCDTVGHAKKPYSREYVDTMNHVDQRIEQIVNETESFFGKDTTAYVFTADHGMTDWGSHGSGSPSETETPLIAWGAGLKTSGFRRDIEQASITPLIASLIGIPIPTNNEGALPWQYFNAAYQEYIGQALLSNVKQLAHQVTGSRGMTCEKSDSRESELKYKIEKIEQYLYRRNVSEAIRNGEEAIGFSKNVLSFFRRYQRTEFLCYLTLFWLGWMVTLISTIVRVKRRVSEKCQFLLIELGFPIVLLITLLKYAVSDCSTWRSVCYPFIATISVWFAVAIVITSRPVLELGSMRKLMEIGGTLFLLVTLFIGLSHRFALSMGMLSTIFIQTARLKNMEPPMFFTSLALCVFPLLPVVEPYPRVYIVMIGIGVTMLIVLINEKSQTRKIMEILRLIVTSLVYAEIIDGRYWISWIILLTTPLCILCYPTEPKGRVLGIMLGFFCPLALLSASYEPLFFLTLAINLLGWMQTAPTTLKSLDDTLTTNDLINAALFMLYTLLCFFGTGNMASISSFNPSWTRHFITVFSPFLMMSLILFKLSIPLILVGCASYVLGSKSVSLAVLFLGDCLSLPLMYCVTPYGSWLDIGSAISKFIIAISLPCLLLLLQYLSRPLMKLHLKRLGIINLGLLPKKTHIV